MEDDSELIAIAECDDEFDVVQEQLEKQLEEWNEIARSRLSAAREARKLAEADASLLVNRIALLKAEDAKAWKHIETANRKTQEIIRTRQKREAELQAKEEYKRLQQEKLEEQRRRNEESRARARAAKIDAQASIQGARHTAAQERRAELKARERSLECKRFGELEQRHQWRLGEVEQRHRMSKARLQKPHRVRSESPRGRSGSPASWRPGSSTGGLEQEEQQLLRRIHFSATACKSRPPRPELGYTPLIQDNQLRPNFLERARCAELANARSRFDPEPPLAFVDLESRQ